MSIDNSIAIFFLIKNLINLLHVTNWIQCASRVFFIYLFIYWGYEHD